MHTNIYYTAHTHVYGIYTHTDAHIHALKHTYIYIYI